MRVTIAILFSLLLSIGGLAQSSSPCLQSEKMREFDFWVGDWDVYVRGKKVGENLVEKEVNGCTLVENWKNIQGGTGKSLNVYDASVKKWKQFYIGSQGGVLMFEGNLNGKVMGFTGETLDAKGEKLFHILEFHKLDDGNVRQVWKQSKNKEQWATVWDSVYKKKQGVTKPKKEEVSFKSGDGVDLFADIFTSSKGKSSPLVLLFHQGGANVRAEYTYHIPKLLKRGYNVIAVDTRAGGTRLGGTNRTMENLAGKQFEYCDAYPDLEAALNYAKKNGFGGKTVAWGSSFSAALVFRLAKEHGDKLAGILAFSPASGGPMKDCRPDLYAGDVKIPVLAVRPGREMKSEASKAQMKAFKELGFTTYVAENGVHGSSMLNPEPGQR